jgi:hypothetical protein
MCWCPDGQHCVRCTDWVIWFRPMPADMVSEDSVCLATDQGTQALAATSPALDPAPFPASSWARHRVVLHRVTYTVSGPIRTHNHTFILDRILCTFRIQLPTRTRFLTRSDRTRKNWCVRRTLRSSGREWISFMMVICEPPRCQGGPDCFQGFRAGFIIKSWTQLQTHRQ